ncbi:hypothetical protein LSH36_102g09008 [Paralvinella palmiformis]|uniref:Uncharacterized protein n=1 Tax=Paralvinella palmiformis TaxID=53620 RepID=A0AAD9NCI6_9ANNE|nr:hypothetical protein LSH36_102g09008 [Paralvinella palmiformis]
MFKPKNIPTDHKDLIHDVAYNYHGRRMATCSSDQYVKIWDLVDGDWKCTASLKTHTGSVWRVAWAHPEFGQVIATCSFDRTASIWEELRKVHAPMIAVGSDDTNQSTGSKVMIYEYSDNTRTWTRTCECPVSDTVRDVAFAPNLGRSYHILAVAAKDVLIFTLKPDTKPRRDCLPELGLLTVWRLSWNITGTILASSGDDGCVRLWKVNYLDNWKCIAVMKGDGSACQGQDSKLLGNGSGLAGDNSPPHPNVPLSIRRNALWPYLRTKKDESKVFY